jgi:hypothetical protein
MNMIPVFLFEREVLCDGLHHKVGCGEGGLAAGGQHQLPQGVRHKRVPRLQKKMPKNVVFTVFAQIAHCGGGINNTTEQKGGQ